MLADPSFCCLLLLKVLGELSLFFASTLFALRAYAVSGSSRAVAAVLIPLLVLQLSLSLWSGPRLTFAHQPGLGCISIAIPKSFVAPFGALLVTDSVSFIVLIYYLTRQRVALEKLSRTLLIQGAGYFSVALVCHLSSVVLMGLRLNLGTQILTCEYR